MRVKFIVTAPNHIWYGLWFHGTGIPSAAGWVGKTITCSVYIRSTFISIL